MTVQAAIVGPAGHGCHTLTLLHSERPKLYAILAFLSAVGSKFFDKVYFYVLGKTLSGEQFCMWTGLV